MTSCMTSVVLPHFAPGQGQEARSMQPANTLDRDSCTSSFIFQRPGFSLINVIYRIFVEILREGGSFANTFGS